MRGEDVFSGTERRRVACLCGVIHALVGEEDDGLKLCRCRRRRRGRRRHDYSHLCLLHVAGSSADGDALRKKLCDDAATGVTSGSDNEDLSVLGGGERGSLSGIAE